MSFRIPMTRTLRRVPQHLTNQQHLRSTLQSLSTRHASTSPPSNSESGSTPRPSLDPITLHRLEVQRRAYYKRRSYYASAGFILGMVAIYVTATSVDLDPSLNAQTQAQPSSPQTQKASTSFIKPSRLDTGKRADDPLVLLGRERKIVIQKLGEEPEEKADVVETGTSTVPTFPRILDFYDNPASPSSSTNENLVEYQLLGLGIRTVSFLKIQVYVVGLYIATDDVAVLQQALIKKINPIASTLVAGEKEILRGKLDDVDEGERIWSDVLRDSGVRTLVRIVPTRNTDFGHLRDGWVRCIGARATKEKQVYGDEGFGAAVGEFKGIFNRGSVAKGKELVLARDREGGLTVWFDDGKEGAQRLGKVRDERVSRAVWLGYLSGRNVASESARKSIVDGIMEFVERPVGTVATQVHATVV